MRLLKCYGEDCLKEDIKHPKENLINDGGKNYCKKCLEKKRKEIEDRDNLYHIIEEIFKIPFPTGRMLKEINRFKEERNYTYAGMFKTLLFLKKHTSLQLNKNYGLGIIAYNYDKAIDFFNKQEERVRKHNENKRGVKVEKTYIKKPSNENKLLKEKLINIDDLI